MGARHQQNHAGADQAAQPVAERGARVRASRPGCSAVICMYPAPRVCGRQAPQEDLGLYGMMGRPTHAVMNLFPGDTLEERLVGEEVPCVVALLHLAETPLHVHARRVAHCDLHARNVLVKMAAAENMKMSLVDFDLAKTGR